MSRKSLTKKETALWYQCNNCSCNILSKDREQHSCADLDDTIPKAYTIVRNKKLIANQLSEKPITDDLRTINANKLNGLIFLHESIFLLCDLVLGDYVSVSSSKLPQTAPIVRIAWPNANQNTGLICVSAEGIILIRDLDITF